jgi:type III restriction enzyme
VPQTLIENPILNSPFEEPRRHHKFDDDGITEEIADGRWRSCYFIPIATPRKKGKQLTFETQWTKDRAKENDHVNFIRSRVSIWRATGYPNVTPITRAGHARTSPLSPGAAPWSPTTPIPTSAGRVKTLA